MFMCDVIKTPPYARAILFTVNYCLFANGDVSIRFYGEIDNVVLESFISYSVVVFAEKIRQIYLHARQDCT